MKSRQQSHLNTRPQEEEIAAYFSGKLDRPCYIIGNGPSADIEIDLPENALVFRMNWFFLENHKRFGRRVDGYFFSAQDDLLMQELERVVVSKDYEISKIFSPLNLKEVQTIWPKFVDHWAFLATNSTIARFLMSRPLPTQGLQVLATLLLAGFKDIRLVGIDFYENQHAGRRYAYEVPKHLKFSMQKKDLKNGYESEHNLATDLRFLEGIRQEFSEACVQVISGSDKLIATFNRQQPPPSETKRPCSKLDISNLSHAYVTYVDGDYYHGARALARSLSAVSDVPLYVMYSDPAIPSRLSHHQNIRFRKVEPVTNPNARLDHGRFKSVYTKLRVFEVFMEMERIVFIDADAIVLKPIEELFDCSGFSACPDWGVELRDHVFNSGVFSFQPSEALRQKVFDAIGITRSEDGGDQGLLNTVITGWNELPSGYNTLKRLREHHAELFNLDEVKILHFVGEKPWNRLDFEFDFADLDAIWLNFLNFEERAELVEFLRREHVSKRRKKLKLSEAFIRIHRGLRKTLSEALDDPKATLSLFGRKVRVLWLLLIRKEPN